MSSAQNQHRSETNPGSPKLHWTPIQVRGKRHKTVAERAAAHKRRHAALRKTRSSKQMPSEVDDDATSPPRKQRRMATHTTALEALPAEILQLIFEYSLNLDFPLTCTRTVAALSGSQHLHTRLTTELLRPILRNHDHSDVLQASVKDAHRLLSSRFMSWTIFSEYLTARRSVTLDASKGEVSLDELCKVWVGLEPAESLLPPTKLLRAPFTESKSAFLTVLAASGHPVLAHNKGLHAEVAREGLEHAVRVGDVVMLGLFFRLGMPSDTDLLRTAVAGRNISPRIFELIVSPSDVEHNGQRGRVANDAIDFLDEELWQQSSDYGAPPWLMRALKDAQVAKEQRLLEQHERNPADV